MESQVFLYWKSVKFPLLPLYSYVKSQFTFVHRTMNDERIHQLNECFLWSYATLSFSTGGWRNFIKLHIVNRQLKGLSNDVSLDLTCVTGHFLGGWGEGIKMKDEIFMRKSVILKINLQLLTAPPSPHPITFLSKKSSPPKIINYQPLRDCQRLNPMDLKGVSM